MFWGHPETMRLQKKGTVSSPMRNDPLGRLSEIQKDGQMQTRYGYDAFGN